MSNEKVKKEDLIERVIPIAFKNFDKIKNKDELLIYLVKTARSILLKNG